MLTFDILPFEVLAAASAPGFAVSFLAGLLSFLSPCVLPLVPGYLSLMSGMSASEIKEAPTFDRGRVVGLSLLFVAGFSIVFVAYGAAASGLGALINEHQRVLTRVAGVSMILMGLIVSGAMRVPFLGAEKRLQISPSNLGPYAAPVMGMAFAFGWTPCVGPILASVLALAATEETLTDGVYLLLAYSAGLGVPFVLTAVGLARLQTTLAWFRRHGRAIDMISGLLLVGFGVAVLTGQLTRLARVLTDVWIGFGLV